MSGKLKYHLYYRALDEAFTYAKEYGRSKGLDVKCYVPTHSLLNYSQWKIVSPEASLASLPCVDGYIAQVWTGTSREPDYFDGICKERVFETAFLEYGCMASMTAPTGRKVWFLTDPIEDWPRDWDDYRRNYQATFTAQLLYPQINSYEIMPWPERIYTGLYNKSKDSDEKIHIPSDYATMMQIMVNALQNMPLAETQVSGTHGINVLMGNSLMFQRFPEHEGYDDPQLSNFYGMSMPLLKTGVPVGIVHIENLGFERALKDTKVLIMTYSNMKPLDSKAHAYIAEWVKAGGNLIYAGRDDDPFQTVSEWWNKDGNNYASPSDHLFSLMGISSAPSAGDYKFGKGKVHIIRQDPKEFVLEKNGAEPLIGAVEELCGGNIEKKNSFLLERGMYLLAAVLDESVSPEPLKLDGRYIDLYDPSLPICQNVEVRPGVQRLFIDLSKVRKDSPMILAAASRAENETLSGRTFSYVAKSPAATVNVSRVLLPAAPKSLKVNDKECLDMTCWDESSQTYLLTFDNNPDGVSVEFAW